VYVKKNAKLGPSTEATSAQLPERAQLLLARCLILLNNVDGAYYYEAIGTASIPGSLSHSLCVTDEQLMTIYRYCGFYNVKRNCFYDSIVQGFIEGSNVPIGITRYKNPTTKICSLLMKIGQGSYPSKPFHQVKAQLQPPSHRLKKEERQLVASLLKLCCCQEPDTTSTADSICLAPVLLFLHLISLILVVQCIRNLTFIHLTKLP
jgi:hypothetical protein